MDPRVKQVFIEALTESGNVAAAAKVIGYSVRYMYEVRDADPEFKEAWKHALDERFENWIAMCRQRAFEGHQEPVIYQGMVTYLRDFDAIDPDTGKPFPPHLAPIKRDENGAPVPLTQRKFSDSLVKPLLAAHRPEYRDASTLALTGAEGGPVEINDAAAAARIAAILEEARARRDAADNSDIV
jgi:hypothetical protein